MYHGAAQFPLFHPIIAALHTDFGGLQQLTEVLGNLAHLWASVRPSSTLLRYKHVTVEKQLAVLSVGATSRNG